MKTLILGCGYLGRRVAARWINAGHEVAALTRSREKAGLLHDVGITPIVGDVTQPTSLAKLPPSDVVLYAVGYDRASGVDRREVVVQGLETTLSALAGKTQRIVFISTTSVYGHSNGEWIDEDSPTTPASDAGRIALEAEELFRRDPLRNVTVLRLSGLYGPGRLLRRTEQLRSQEPIAGDGNAWLNLIHVEDAVTAVQLAAERVDSSCETYLVSDDLPVRRREYYGRLAELTDSPPPVFDSSKASRSTGLGKRCRNLRVKQELGLTLQFPTCTDGLAAALRHSPTNRRVY